MANSLIKGLALTLGGGLAVGLGIKLGQSSAPPQLPLETVDFGPMLDRIEGVEKRIVTVESSNAALAALTESGPVVIPSVHELEERVQAQNSEVEALRAAIQRATEKHDARIDDLGCAVSSLESRIPDLIDHGVMPKFEELHGRMQREMQETASQTLEIFADRIQARVVEKITSIEGDLGRQAEAIKDLRDFSLKNDQNLQRLLAGVENLADKINRKFETSPEPPRPGPSQRPVPSSPSSPVSPTGGGSNVPASSQFQSEERTGVATTPAPGPATSLAAQSILASQIGARTPEFSSKIELGETANVHPPRESFPAMAPRTFSGPEFEELIADSPRSSGFRKAAFAGGGIALTAMFVGGIELSGVLHKPTSAHSIINKVSGSATSAAADSLNTKKLTEQSEMLDQARAFTQKRDYAKAEDIYRAILKTDPSNTEVKRLLASALFREEKIDESAQVLNSITQEKQDRIPGTPNAQ